MRLGQEIKILGDAFEDALRTLRLVNRDDPATEIVAKKIIELAQRGERDPVRLRQAAVQSPYRHGRAGGTRFFRLPLLPLTFGSQRCDGSCENPKAASPHKTCEVRDVLHTRRGASGFTRSG